MRAMRSWLRLAVCFAPLGVWLAGACAPQDVRLFAPASTDADTDELPTPDAGGPPDEPVAPPAPVQPACQSEACEACVAAAACVFGTSPGLCHPLTGACAVACDPVPPNVGVVRRCPAGQLCHPEYALCVQCLDASACSVEGARACDEARGVCVGCVDDTTCGGGEAVCDTTAQRCVECTPDSGCPLGSVCDPDRLQCVGCVDDGDCGGEDGRCLLSQQICVECLDNDDCTEPDRLLCNDEFECDDDLS